MFAAGTQPSSQVYSCGRSLGRTDSVTVWVYVPHAQNHLRHGYGWTAVRVSQKLNSRIFMISFKKKILIFLKK